ncbi:MAG TPA: response regulator [Elusimicrobiales bacterium]|nr:response regulator [Elusimicrobiales bacterium]
MTKNKTYTTFDIARILDLSPTTVANWIDSGKLKAFVTVGGHRRVAKEDLAEFLKANKMPLPPGMAGGSGLKVLIVEDDTKFLKIAAAFFRKLGGFEVFTVANGFEAGRIMESQLPELVILDIMLPGLDGFKVCEIIKSLNRDTRVIAVTGYDADNVKRRMLGSGADAYLTKPFSFKDLERLVRELVGDPKTV